MPDRTNRREPSRFPATTTIAGRDIDVQSGDNGVGTGPGYSGQEYDANDFAIDRALRESAEGGPPSSPGADGPFPPDNGRRACFDQQTGVVRGSGAGAGGGNPGEDFASDSAAGDGFPFTGNGPRKDGRRRQG